MTNRTTQSAAAAAAALALGAAMFVEAAPAVAHRSAATTSSAAGRNAKKAPPAPPKLSGVVSAQGAVILKDGRGAAVRRLRPGWYTVLIAVETRTADFHLVGPGTNKSTGRHFLGDVLWGVHFVRGTYRYMSDSNATGTTHSVSVS
jgi:hypothetical protein